MAVDGMTSGPGPTDGHGDRASRHVALAERLARVRERIGRACAAADRRAETVSLLVVSKTFSADDVLAVAALGQRDFGENYLSEALPKIEQCAGRPLVWHFIGPIQSNKTRPIAEHFDWVHSVDRPKIAERLAAQRPPGLAPLNLCIQINISAEPTKSGCSPADALTLARIVAALPELRLRGVMAIPAPSDDPVAQRAAFARVRQVIEQWRADGLRPDTLSIGMSADLEAAIAEGATIVRVGSAIFGAREF